MSSNTITVQQATKIAWDALAIYIAPHDWNAARDFLNEMLLKHSTPSIVIEKKDTASQKTRRDQFALDTLRGIISEVKWKNPSILISDAMLEASKKE